MEMARAATLAAPLDPSSLTLLVQRRTTHREPQRELIERSPIPNSRINLNDMRDVDALHNFHFTVADIHLISTALRLPNIVITRERGRSLVAEAVSML